MSRLSRSAVILAVLVHAGCADPASGREEAAPAPVESITTVYDCQSTAGAFRFTTRTGPGELAVWLPPRFERPYLVLARSAAASSTKYHGDGVTVRTKGSEASLEVDGESIRGCAENRYESGWEHAKLSGVDYRGVGNEPGWVLEIRHSDRIRFEYDYGQKQITAAAAEPRSDPASRTSTWKMDSEAGVFVVTIEGTGCSDTMSDHTYESTVTVRLGEREFRGCGRALH